MHKDFWAPPFPLQPSFIQVGRGCYAFAARTVGWTLYEGEKSGEEKSRRAVAGVGCCLCPCGCVGSLHWLPPSSPRLRSPLPSLLPVIPAATPTAEPFPAVGFSSFGANPDFCTCGRTDYDGGFGSTCAVGASFERVRSSPVCRRDTRVITLRVCAKTRHEKRFAPTFFMAQAADLIRINFDEKAFRTSVSSA